MLTVRGGVLCGEIEERSKDLCLYLREKGVESKQKQING